MNVSGINAVIPNASGPSRPGFGKKNDYENPVSKGTEKGLAVLSSLAGSTVLGTIVGGLTSCIPNSHVAMETKNIAGFLKAYKVPAVAGLGAAAITLLLTLPAKIYNTNVNAFVKQKEMDVFTRDRELKSNLTEEVHEEVKNPYISLDKKLDDNLKLQMANRGAAIGIANVTSQQ